MCIRDRLHHRHFILIALARTEVMIGWLIMASITLPQLCHEVAIEHSLSHLYLVLIYVAFAAMIAA